jgi:polysaccharide export outer membrane protein
MGNSSPLWVKWALAGSLALGACRGTTPVGSFVWVQDFEADEGPDAAYVIGPGDVINVRVFNQDGVSAKVRVRSDGMISLPFLGDTQAAGFPPLTLATRIQLRLKDYIVNPVVTVSLEEPRPFEVSVVGEVVKPGVYRLENRAGVLAALASAGGLTDYADRDRVFVLREGKRIRFTFRALTMAQPKAIAFHLRVGDVVVAE